MTNKNTDQNKAPSQAPFYGISNTLFYLFKNPICVGSFLGMLEAAADHPFWVVKTHLQRKEISKLPSFFVKLKVALKAHEGFRTVFRELYRGVGIDIASMIPITVIQVTIAKMTERLLCKNRNQEGTPDRTTQVISAFTGGVASTAVGTPVELVMSHMKVDQGVKKTTAYFIREHGIASLYTGNTGTGCRDGLFTVGFLVLPLIIEKKILSYDASYTKTAAVVSGPLAGVLSSVVSHAFDSIKTRQQLLAAQVKQSFTEAAKEIVFKEGFLKLYEGLFPRTLRVTSAITLMNGVHKIINHYVKQHEASLKAQR